MFNSDWRSGRYSCRFEKELAAIGIRPYNEQTHEGMLRHVVIRKARATGEVMVVVVTKKKNSRKRSRCCDNPKACPECYIHYAKR